MLELLFENQIRISRGIEELSKRYLYYQINFDQRLIGIVGARGVGKTTMLLQHLKERYNDPNVALYISADHIHVSAQGLYNIAEKFSRNGGVVLCIDEIHKQDNWAKELKNIYDSFPDIRLIISGSSAFQITKQGYDLSRRLVKYALYGLSFREFINLKKGLNLESFPISEILDRHTKIAQEICDKIKVFPLFKEYTKTGYYPFWLEGVNEYYSKLENIISKILYEDIPSAFSIKYTGIHQLKRFLYILATSPPFQVNISGLARELGISRESLYQYLDFLVKSFVINQVWKFSTGKSYQRKAGKIYFENTNLLSLLSNTPNIQKGVIRETFFINQFQTTQGLFVSLNADFENQDRTQFEIGGRRKLANQLDDNQLGYLVLDDMEIGHRNRIPLYLFGFLY